ADRSLDQVRGLLGKTADGQRHDPVLQPRERQHADEGEDEDDQREEGEEQIEGHRGRIGEDAVGEQARDEAIDEVARVAKAGEQDAPPGALDLEALRGAIRHSRARPSSPGRIALKKAFRISPPMTWSVLVLGFSSGPERRVSVAIWSRGG